VTELKTQNLDAMLEVDSLKASPVVCDEVDCGDCWIFLVGLTALKENHAPKCEGLDVLRIELAELLLKVSFGTPSHEFTFNVGIDLISDLMVLTPLI
jgi:hypothetical protein